MKHIKKFNETMSYPSIEDVELSDPVQIMKWQRFLPSPSNYDGIIARNIIDLHLGGSDYSKYSEFMGDVYMVFSSSQTKIEKEI